MVVNSPLPRDYRLHCKRFSDKKLEEQYQRHALDAASGCKGSAACLKEVLKELLRRQSSEYKCVTYDDLKKRRLKARAK